jgi:phosphoribosylanthranilate isomerase
MGIWTKICGVTGIEDALAAVEAGADAVGLNFCRTSPRYRDPAAAGEIVRAVGSSVATYGVFASAEVDEIAEIARRLRLGGVQLHGGEDADFVASLRGLLGPDVEILRVIAVTARAGVLAALKAARDHRVLLDSPRGGGSGSRFDAQEVAGIDLSAAIVAGGLTPANVGDVVRSLRPYGVDVASGVESTPGVKDHRRVREFIENAKRSAA